MPSAWEQELEKKEEDLQHRRFVSKSQAVSSHFSEAFRKYKESNSKEILSLTHLEEENQKQ